MVLRKHKIIVLTMVELTLFKSTQVRVRIFVILPKGEEVQSKTRGRLPKSKQCHYVIFYTIMLLNKKKFNIYSERTLFSVFKLIKTNIASNYYYFYVFSYPSNF